MSTRFARPIEIALGALFIVSAASKAMDVYAFAVQVRAYGIVRDESTVLGIAYLMVGLETLLGVALLGGFQFGGFTLLFTGGLLVGFSALIAYSWAFKGLADCGCFGAYIKMGPGASIAKNIVLLAMTGLVWTGLFRKPKSVVGDETTVSESSLPKSSGTARAVLAVAGILVVGGAFMAGKPAPAQAPKGNASNSGHVAKAEATPFAEFVPRLGGAPVPLAKGEFFVALLNAGCDHCQAVARTLNELQFASGMPPVVAIMSGTENEMREFMSLTDAQFPIQTIDMLPFMNLLPEEASAPPSFYFIRDGAEVRHLVAEEPSYDELLEFATKAEAPAAEDKQ